jgi:hypothetical protein
VNTIKFNVRGFSIEREAPIVQEYGDEVMLAGWNPQVAEASELARAMDDTHIPLPVGLLSVDVDTFLQRMYEYQ